MAGTGSGAVAVSSSSWNWKTFMSCFLPSSVMLKSAGLEPLDGVAALVLHRDIDHYQLRRGPEFGDALGGDGGGGRRVGLLRLLRLWRLCRDDQQSAQECGGDGAH